MTSALPLVHAATITRGRHLQYFTIAWNSLEGLIALLAGFFEGSVALVGFGFDSLIEVTTGAAVLWRLYRDERAERLALRVVGVSFAALAVYIAYDSLSSLLLEEAPERSVAGMVLAAVSLIVMPLLGQRKRLHPLSGVLPWVPMRGRPSSVLICLQSCWPGSC
jgi:divalent metal cation (Fe/Co/Zn/Cd) transporter